MRREAGLMQEGSRADGRGSQVGRDFPLMCVWQHCSMLLQPLQLWASVPCQFSVSVSAEVGL